MTIQANASRAHHAPFNRQRYPSENSFSHFAMSAGPSESSLRSRSGKTPPRVPSAPFRSPSGVLTSPSINTSESFFAAGHSRTNSMGTLWSSAEVPLFLEGHRGSGSDISGMQSTPSLGTNRSESNSTLNRGTTLPNSSDKGPRKDSEGSVAELLLSEDGHIFTAVRPAPRILKSSSNKSNDQGAVEAVPAGWTVTHGISPTKAIAVLQRPGSAPGSEEGTPKKKRPERLDLSREANRQTQSTSSVQKETAPSAPPSNLYRHAERFFDVSYSMAAGASPQAPPALTTPEMARLSRFSDETSRSVGLIDGQDCASSHKTYSSTGSSGPPELNEHSTHIFHQGMEFAMGASGKLHHHEPMTPLRVAVAMASPREPAVDATPMPSRGNTPFSSRRPSTTDAAVPQHQPLLQQSDVRRTHTSSDQDLARRLEDEANGRQSSEGATKQRSGLFGLRMRAVSTPRLRQSRNASAEMEISHPLPQNADNNTSHPPIVRPQHHPPQAPSGRFRVPSEKADSLRQSHSNDSNLSSQRRDSDTHTQQKTRRPSSSEAIAAAARRFRRPSRKGSNSSLNGNTPRHSCDEARQRTVSNASSQAQANLHQASSVASLRSASRKSKTMTPVQLPRPKTKGGWATYLAQGLTLHLEQGSRKYTCRMKYVYYDPFGIAEHLCSEEQQTTTRGRCGSASGPTGAGTKARNGSFSVNNGDGDTYPDDQTGVLEFEPELDNEPMTQMAFSSNSGTPVILKHLTIGEDTRADLITRQADLSLDHHDMQIVSGSERKGKVSWRFSFLVGQAYADGRALDGVEVVHPQNFSCSTSLLDPARARKSRMITLIKKQIGPHIESQSTAVAPEREEGYSRYTPPRSSPAASRREAPLSPRSVPRDRQGSRCHTADDRVSTPSSPVQERFQRRMLGSQGGASIEMSFAEMRNGSVASVASSSAGSTSWSPMSRSGLVPFKAKRSQGVLGANEFGRIGMHASPLAANTSLTSPLTSVDGSPSMMSKSVCDAGSISSTSTGKIARQGRQTNGSTNGTALGLETGGVGNTSTGSRRAEVEFDYDDGTVGQWASSQSRTRSRRLRAQTEEPTRLSPSRPPTASEEIKMAYLSSAARADVASQRVRTPTNADPRHHEYVAPSIHIHVPRRMTSASVNVTTMHTGFRQSTSPMMEKSLPHTPLSHQRKALTARAKPQGGALSHFATKAMANGGGGIATVQRRKGSLAPEDQNWL